MLARRKTSINDRSMTEAMVIVISPARMYPEFFNEIPVVNKRQQ